MSPEITLLRTLLCFARSPRRLGPSSLANVIARVGEEPAAVQRVVASLSRQGLVLRTGDVVRLSLPGLAIAVACDAVAPKAKAKSKAKARASIVARPRLPAERRRSAA